MALATLQYEAALVDFFGFSLRLPLFHDRSKQRALYFMIWHFLRRRYE